jgi:hypothetical protein
MPKYHVYVWKTVHDLYETCVEVDAVDQDAAEAIALDKCTEISTWQYKDSLGDESPYEIDYVEEI